MLSVYVVRDVNRSIIGVYQSKEVAQNRIDLGVKDGECKMYTAPTGEITYDWDLDWFPVGS